MKILRAFLSILLVSSNAIAQEPCNNCNLILTYVPSQTGACNGVDFKGGGEVCNGDSYCTVYTVTNLQTGESYNPWPFGYEGINFHGNNTEYLFSLPNGRWRVTAKIINGDCINLTKSITVVSLSIPKRWYRDFDGDGKGNINNPSELVCTQPIGFVEDATDCNDNCKTCLPGADEICGDGLDNNCKDGIDENTKTFYIDWDGDGIGTDVRQMCHKKKVLAQEGINTRLFFVDLPVTVNVCEKPAGYSERKGDCNDCDMRIHPGAKEICDTIDNDCDGHNNEGLGANWYPDKDRDKHGDAKSPALYILCNKRPPQGYVRNHDDFNDDCKTCNPGAPEKCGDGLDNDGEIYTPDLVTAFFDRDNDGHYATVLSTGCGKHQKSQGDDCDDTNGQIYPGNGKSCTDNDCNGTVDEYENDGSFILYQNLYFEKRPELLQTADGLTETALNDEPFYYSATIESKNKDLLCFSDVHLEQWDGQFWKTVNPKATVLSEIGTDCKECLNFQHMSQRAYNAKYSNQIRITEKLISELNDEKRKFINSDSIKEELNNVKQLISHNTKRSPQPETLCQTFYTITISIDSFVLNENVTALRLCYKNCFNSLNFQSITYRNGTFNKKTKQYSLGNSHKVFLNLNEKQCFPEVNLHVKKAPPFLILISKGGSCITDMSEGGTCNPSCTLAGITPPTLDPIFYQTANCQCEDPCGTNCTIFTQLLASKLGVMGLISSISRFNRDVWNSTINNSYCPNITNFEGLNNRVVTGRYPNSELENVCGSQLTFESLIDEWRIQKNKYVILVGHSQGAAKLDLMIRDHWRWGNDIEVPLLVSMDATSLDEPIPKTIPENPLCPRNFSNGINSVGNHPEYVLNFYQTQNDYPFQNGSPIIEADEQYDLSCCFSHTDISRSTFVHNRTLALIKETIIQKRVLARTSQ